VAHYLKDKGPERLTREAKVNITTPKIQSSPLISQYDEVVV